MKGLLLAALFISPVAFAVSPMDCSQLSQFISANQHEIFTATNGTSPGCTQETLPGITQGRNEDVIKSVIDEFGCSRVSAIDESISKIENEIALLTGIAQMKKDVADNKAEVSNPNLTKARKAAQEFRHALVSARALEGLLSTQSDSPLIRDLKKIPVTQRNDAAKFKAAIDNLCNKRAGLVANDFNACAQGFNIDPDALVEINTLIDSGSLSDQQLTEWSTTLAIKKADGTDYSFSQMYRELDGALGRISEGRTGVSRSDLKAIAALPKFKDAYPLSFMNTLAGRSDSMKIHTAVDGAKNLVEELKKRQATQTMSKVSWILKEAGGSLGLTDEQKSFCNEMVQDIAKTRLCWKAINDAQGSMTPVARDQFSAVKNSVDNSLSYLETLENSGACLSDANLAKADQGFQFDTPECAGLNATPEVINEKVARSEALKELKKKILSGDDRKIKMTNFALSKFTEQCMKDRGNILDSTIECPADDKVKIDSVAKTLISDILGMAVVRTDLSTPDISAECDDAKDLEINLCKYINTSAPANPNTSRPPIPSSDSAYMSPQNARDPSRDAFNDGLSNIGWSIVNQLQQRPMMYSNPYMNFNPYPYNYNPYSGVAGLSPADQILYSARFYNGYGFYAPTYGVTPYTAFPLISPYVQATRYSTTGNTSSYFTNFGTYK